MASLTREDPAVVAETPDPGDELVPPIARPDHVLDPGLREDLLSEAQNAVRKHVARELHDQVAQTLTTMLVEMENFKVEQVGRQSVISGLTDLQDSTREVLNSLRRLLYDLRGESSTEQEFVDQVRTRLLAPFQERTGIETSLAVSSRWPHHLSAAAALNLHRILEEALNNVRLHSRASAVEVRFAVSGGGDLDVCVADDGVGVLPEESRLPGLGTLGMHERAILLGGRLRIGPGQPGGTVVRVVVPASSLT